jgi:hypothetical protein
VPDTKTPPASHDALRDRGQRPALPHEIDVIGSEANGIQLVERPFLIDV